MLLKTFTVAVDGRAPSDAALAWALATVEAGGDDLRLVHVVERTVAGGIEDCTEEELVAAEAVLARAAAGVPASVRPRLRTEILVGPGPQTIAAQAGPGVVLVIGTHKTGFLHGRVMGSRGLIIAALAKGELAVIPSIRLSGRRGVVLGVVPGKGWAETSWVAGVHATRFGEEVRVVHASNPNAASSAAGGFDDESVKVEMSLVEHRFQRDFPALVVHSRRSKQDAVTAFLDAARTASLLILPVVEAEQALPFTGSVAHDVLLNINAPVIMIPISVAGRDGALAGLPGDLADAEIPDDLSDSAIPA